MAELGPGTGVPVPGLQGILSGGQGGNRAFALLCLVNLERASLQILAVEFLGGLSRLLRSGHGDKCEASRPCRFPGPG